MNNSNECLIIRTLLGQCSDHTNFAPTSSAKQRSAQNSRSLGFNQIGIAQLSFLINGLNFWFWLAFLVIWSFVGFSLVFNSNHPKSEGSAKLCFF